MKIAIIGAGISGLSLAHFLKAKGANVEVFESSFRLGGYAGTFLDNGYKVERGPSSLMDNEPAFQTLIDSLQLREKVIYPKPTAKNRFIFYKSQIFQVPTSPPTLIKSKLLSTKSKLRIFKDLFIKPSPDAINETIYEYFKRHFGEQVAERLVFPAVVGVYAGNAKKLSMRMAFPKIAELDARFGSLIKGLANVSKRKPKTRLFTFQNGTQDLVDALENSLSSRLHLNFSVDKVLKTEKGWLLISANKKLEFDAVVLSVGHTQIKKLIDDICPNLPALKASDLAPVISLSIAFNEPLSLNGYGILIHPDENLNTLGVLFPTDTFENRAPKNHSLLTFIMGGVFHPELLYKTDSEIVNTALVDLEKIMGITIPAPVKYWLNKHPEGITQYNLEAVHTLDTIKSSIESHKGLFLHSHGYGGVSLNDCIRKSLELSQLLGYN